MLEAMEFPEPVIAVAIEPKTRKDQGGLGSGCRACWRRTIFEARNDNETGQTMISGIGDPPWRSSSTASRAGSTWTRSGCPQVV